MARRDGLRVKMSKIKGIPGSERMLRTAYQFQSPPMEEFAYEAGREHSRIAPISRVEYITRGAKRVRTVSFQTLVVEWGNFVVEQDWDTEALRDELVEVAERGWPFRLLVTSRYGATPELEMFAVLDRARVALRAGENDARYFDLSFVEWRDPMVDRKSHKRRTGGRQLPFTITLEKNGDYTGLPGARREDVVSTMSTDLTLSLIATLAYGDPALARPLGKALDIPKWGANTPLIEHPKYKGKGGKITVPRLEYLPAALVQVTSGLGSG